MAYRGDNDGPIVRSNGPQDDRPHVTSHANDDHHEDSERGAHSDDSRVIGLLIHRRRCVVNPS